MANEARKLKRAPLRGTDGGAKDKKKDLRKPLVQSPAEIPDPLGPAQLKSMLIRLSLPVLAVWVLGGTIAGFSTTLLWQILPLAIAGVVTLVAAGIVIWALRQAKKARGVAGILRGVETAADRQEAIEKLDGSFKKNDPAAVFAKAQLEMQDDPDKALKTLEQIDLNKVMAPVADEARAQRAMIHLLKGQVSLARQLVDNIELKRHQEAKTRAMLAAVVSEAWARSGLGKKALETLELFDLADAEYEQLLPQLHRAYAYAYAHTNNPKGMRRSLRKLLDIDPRLLGAFMMKKSHPLLQKEARQLIERSGVVPRKMVVQRR